MVAVQNDGTSGRAASTSITVDFYDGASGPTLLVVLETLPGVELLKATFDYLATSPVGTVVMLHREAGVSLQASVSEIKLRVTAEIPARHLRQDGNRAFEWRNTDYEWETAGMMLEPFLDGQPGHQYLTNDYPPYPNVTVSSGEGLHRRDISFMPELLRHAARFAAAGMEVMWPVDIAAAAVEARSRGQGRSRP